MPPTLRLVVKRIVLHHMEQGLSLEEKKEVTHVTSVTEIVIHLLFVLRSGNPRRMPWIQS